MTMNTLILSEPLFPASPEETPEEILWLADFNSPNTRETYARTIQEFNQAMGIQTQEQFRNVSSAHIIVYKRWLEQEGKSARTINNHLAALSSLFKHLQDKQLVTLNPVQGIKRKRVDQSKTVSTSLAPSQVQEILKQPDTTTLKGIRDYAILMTLFYTGCRASELCNLKVKNYHLDRGFHILNFTIKGGEVNKVAIHASLNAAITRYLNATGHQDNKELPLFLSFGQGRNTTPTQKPLNRRMIWYLIKRYSHSINSAHPHMARATFTTTALDNNCPIEQVQKTVRHKNIATTQMYDHRKHRHEDSASLTIRY